MLSLILGSVVCVFIARRRSPVRLVANKIDRNNVRIKFFNEAYADAFLEMNKSNAQSVNPWKFD